MRPVALLAVLAVAVAGCLDAGPLDQGTAGDTPTDPPRGPHTLTHTTVAGAEGTPIAVTIFKPGTADAAYQAPVLLHGHGWAGTRWTEVAAAKPYLDAGFGVVSIDQRGHGESGGTAQFMDPALEAQDVKAVIDHVATLDWVLFDAPGDPRLGALGGSYGGAYQLMTALAETEESGATRFDALAPEITWHDLGRSLAPDDVVRSSWINALYLLAKATGTRVDADVDAGFRHTLATGEPPDGADGSPDLMSRFAAHSPAAFAARGVHLDVPVLFRQGFTDNLFTFGEGYANWATVLTPTAQNASHVVGHLEGHTLPSAVPPGGIPLGDPCSGLYGGWTSLTIAWYRHLLLGDAAVELPTSSLLLANEQGGCAHLDALPTPGMHDLPDFVATTGPAGAPLYVPITTLEGAESRTLVGPVPFAANATTTSADTRLFLGIALGEDEADARLVNNQWTPVRVLGAGAHELALDLVPVSAHVEPGETLYLVVAGGSDQFSQHGSREAGVVTLGDVHVGLPWA